MTNDPADFLPLTALSFEILLALGSGGRHGYDIMVAIEERTAGRMSLNPGTLYRALDRLHVDGLLAVEERAVAGSERRVFRLSALGRKVAGAEAQRLSDQVNAARMLRLLPGTAR